MNKCAIMRAERPDRAVSSDGTENPNEGPIVTDDFVDMGASASVEDGAAVFGTQVGAAQLY